MARWTNFWLRPGWGMDGERRWLGPGRAGNGRLGKLSIGEYKDEKGFELIAEALGIGYPSRPAIVAAASFPG